MTTETQTYFAPAERASEGSIATDSERFLKHSLIQQLYDALNVVVLILNAQRQIVFANRSLLDLFELETSAALLGKRPGEAFDCLHASEGNGCGTTRFCKECGAVKAILTSQQEYKPQVQDCRILRNNGKDALNLRVCASPLTLDGKDFTVFSIEDTSDSERRKSLERIFFHDIMNTAIGVRGLGELLAAADTDEIPEYTHQIYKGADTLVQEIESQRDLLAVENRELNVTLKSVSVRDVLSHIQAVYQRHEVSQQKTLCIKTPATDIFVTSDSPLLERVIGNMVKNALEACSAGDTVTLNTHTDDDHVVFVVHNPGVIPEPVQLQLFQRSFSTKGAGRGLGTYSMKLISERYLNGAVSFISNEQKGTEFYAIIPSSRQNNIKPVSATKPTEHLPISVLIVEDVPVNLKIVKHMLTKSVKNVASATNGQKAIDEAMTGKYDVILMDIDLPDISGIDATKEIIHLCAEKGWNPPCIIGLTAYRLVSDAQKCLDAGMCGCLSKPVAKEELLRTLSDYIKPHTSC